MADCSSGTTSVPMTAKFLFLRSSPTAGPERSARSPLAQESLTVTTAAVIPSGVEEDIFFLLFGFSAIALRLVELAQAFHQQTLRVQVGSLLRGLAFKIDFEVSVDPTQNLKYRRIPKQGAISSVIYLAFLEVQFAFVVFVGEGEGAAFAAHFEGLHQVDHIHL